MKIRALLVADRGSLAPLGLFGLLLIGTVIAVTTDSRAAFIQQRQLNALSDALALDLADLAKTGTKVDEANAIEELGVLKSSSQHAEIAFFAADDYGQAVKVKIKLCRQFAGIFSPSWIGANSNHQLCSTSSAISSTAALGDDPNF